MFEDTTNFVFYLYLIGIVLALIFTTIVGILVHSGIFQNVDEIGTGAPPIGATVIAYKFQKGPYSDAGQVFTEAAIICPRNKAIGIYYDDPEKVAPQDLRYVVGSVLSQESDKIDENQVKEFTSKDFKIIHLPKVDFAVKTKFPYTTSLSVLFAIWKAYPELKYYIQDHKLCAYPFLEFYDDNFIHFMAPLSKQDQFFVPECESKPPPDAAFETTLNDSQSIISDFDKSEDSEYLADDCETSQEVSLLRGSQSREVSQLSQSTIDSTINTSCLGEAPVSEVCLPSDGNVNEPDTVEEDPSVSDDGESTSSFEMIKTDQSEN